MSNLDWREILESIGWLYAIAVVAGTLVEMAMVHAASAPPLVAALLGGAVAGALLATRMGTRARLRAVWIGASALGWVASVFLAGALDRGPTGPWFNFLSGFALGTAQWLVVRGRQDNAGVWVVLGAIGWSILWPATWMVGNEVIGRNP